MIFHALIINAIYYSHPLPSPPPGKNIGKVEYYFRKILMHCARLTSIRSEKTRNRENMGKENLASVQSSLKLIKFGTHLLFMIFSWQTTVLCWMLKWNFIEFAFLRSKILLYIVDCGLTEWWLENWWEVGRKKPRISKLLKKRENSN